VRILIVNAGSSSLKLSVIDRSDEVVVSTDLAISAESDVRAAIREFLRRGVSVDAVGHRVVHGGAHFSEPVLLNDDIDAALALLQDLDPLHNPQSLAAIRELRSTNPTLPQIACFDTSFHLDMPAKASTYALPRQWREEWGLRRFGFHGLSHAWASRRAAELLGQPISALRLVTAHLGAGASLAAVACGRSVDTTMGYTPIEGLVMATRSGSVDPGLLIWVQRHHHLSIDEVETVLDQESGLRGLWGPSGDLRRVIDAMDAGDVDARLAYEVFVYRIQTGVAAMVAAMKGFEGLVFTGGAGEASSRLRVDVCEALRFFGIEIVRQRNEDSTVDRVLSADGASPAVVVVSAREDLEIARHVRALLAV
jgi:acetate kinase